MSRYLLPRSKKPQGNTSPRHCDNKAPGGGKKVVATIQHKDIEPYDAVDQARKYKEMCKFVAKHKFEIALELRTRNKKGHFGKRAHFFSDACQIVKDIPHGTVMVESCANSLFLAFTCAHARMR